MLAGSVQLARPRRKPISMTLDDQKEQFSFAYVRAVASAAQISVSEPAVDDDSIDLIFHRRGGGGIEFSGAVEDV